MSIGEKLKKIADRMRSVYGSGYLHGHSTGYEEGYDVGAEDGGISARKHCLMNHYTESVLGNGTRRLQLQVPFQPDVVAVYSTNPYSNEGANTFKSLLADMRACGKYSVYLQCCDNGGQHTTGSVTTTMARQFISYKDGVWQFELRSDLLPSVVWAENVRYTIMAVKFSDEDPERLLSEQIMLLPDSPPAGSSGTLTYSKTAIDAYYTSEQWKNLTDLKPNWRFVLQ